MHVILHVLYTFLPHKSRSLPGPPAGAHWFWCVGDFAPPRNHGEAQHVEKHGWNMVCNSFMFILNGKIGSRWWVKMGHVCFKCHPYSCWNMPKRPKQAWRTRKGSSSWNCPWRWWRWWQWWQWLHSPRNEDRRWSKDQAGAGTAQYALSVDVLVNPTGNPWEMAIDFLQLSAHSFRPCPWNPLRPWRWKACRWNGYAGPHQTSGAKHRSQSLPNRKYKAIETQLPSGNLT